MVITSTGGLLLPDAEDTGVSIAVSPRNISTSDSSMLIFTASTGEGADGVTSCAGGTVGDAGGEEGIASRGGRDGVRTLMVTRLDRTTEDGSDSSSEVCLSGVLGGAGSQSIFIAESLLASDAGSSPAPGNPSGEEAAAVSTDRLREALLRDVRRRLEGTLLSSKGFGRVEQGSEETARSRLDSSAVEFEA